ncbi:MAG: GIY-YIG nuclease family protein [Candidatus Lernaella stagnicola]|nr:GIY-YIG nuclease family protein [Candidatus Lernaella stagnicola]
MFFVYVLQSETSGRFYCGSTADLEERLKRHNDQNYTGTQTTKRFPGPWRLVWSMELPTRSEAMAKEKQIKKRGIQRFLVDQEIRR